MTTPFPSDEARAELIDELADALTHISNPKEAKALLMDLCTPAEIHSLAERWHVAQLLDEGSLTYRQIHDATGVSTTTIVRVARFLKQEPHGGYRAILAKQNGSSRVS